MTKANSRPTKKKPVERRMVRDAVQGAIKERGWSLRQLSIAAGISYSRVHRWLGEKDAPERGMTEGNINAILTVLGLEVLPGEDGVQSPPPPKPAKKKGAKS